MMMVVGDLRMSHIVSDHGRPISISRCRNVFNDRKFVRTRKQKDDTHYNLDDNQDCKKR